MDNKKQTKEQLLVEIIKLRNSHADWVSGDERRRKEFAKVFNWYQKQGVYGYQSELRMPSWEEIFTEIGKLLATKTFYDLDGNISEMDVRIENIKKP